jgi:hypothetical protein
MAVRFGCFVPSNGATDGAAGLQLRRFVRVNKAILGC